VRSAKFSNGQLLVLGFLLLAWLSLICILAVAPEVYAETLRLAPGENARAAELLFVGALTAFILLVAVGVIRRWRWIFWLLMVAFLSGLLRVPASLVELAGWMPATGPRWYVIFQALISVAQFAIGLVMVTEYQRYGVWGHRPVRRSHLPEITRDSQTGLASAPHTQSRIAYTVPSHQRPLK